MRQNKGSRLMVQEHVLAPELWRLRVEKRRPVCQLHVSIPSEGRTGASPPPPGCRHTATFFGLAIERKHCDARHGTRHETWHSTGMSNITQIRTHHAYLRNRSYVSPGCNSLPEISFTQALPLLHLKEKSVSRPACPKKKKDGWERPTNPLVSRTPKKIRQLNFELTFNGLICNGNGLS